MADHPVIRNDNGIPTLYVKGEPFFALSGEVHNSSASSLAYMKENVWPYVEGMNLNSLIVPIYWEMIEPQKDVFDFELLDGLIMQARERNIHLILLWFGLWKNAESMYVPGWMKTDTQTYFRAEKVNGEKLNTISPLCQAAIDRDANAFAHVMAHIKQVDENESTVIMMQVENEVGLLGTACDYCPAAKAAFESEIPLKLAQLRDTAGSWKKSFGEDAEEIFMAYHFASAIEQITTSGQKEYPLPCYANAWLKQYPWYPGSYPSGGPVKDVHWVWKLAAPSLFTLAPDIYVPYVSEIMETYSYPNNPLLIPEVRKDAVTASYALYAFTHHHAIGYAPFGVEELGLPPESVFKPPQEVIESLKMDPLSFDMRGSKEALSAVYDLVEQLKPLLLKYKGTRHMQSFLRKSDTDQGEFLRFDQFDMEVFYFPKVEACPAASGVIFELTPGKFLIAGMMAQITVHPKAGESVKVEYLKKEAGLIENGQWRCTQPLNGDEKVVLALGRLPVCYYVELYQF